MTPLPPPDTTIVTGAGGWLGTALLHGLSASTGPYRREGSIIGVVRSAEECDVLAAISPQVTPVVADVTDAVALERAFGTATGTVEVIHTAGVIHPRRIAEFDAVNHLGTRAVLEVARNAAVRRMVHVSSNSPFGTNPTTRDRFGRHEPYHPYLGYGWSKMRGELAVLDAVEHGLDAVIVRPPWFYGPWQPPRQTTFFKLIRSGRFPLVGDGSQRRSMVYVDNLVQGIVLAGRTPGIAGRAYWVADPDPYPLHDIVATVRQALEDEGLDCPDRQLRLPMAVARVAERADRAIQATGRYNQQLHVLGELGHNIAVDVSATVDELGYEPEVTLLEGMRRSIRWCLDQGFDL